MADLGDMIGMRFVVIVLRSCALGPKARHKLIIRECGKRFDQCKDIVGSPSCVGDLRRWNPKQTRSGADVRIVCIKCPDLIAAGDECGFSHLGAGQPRRLRKRFDIG